MTVRPIRLLPVVALLAAGLVLAACSGLGGGAPSTGLAPGLTARMDTAGASLNRADALGIVNQYRATRGAPALVADATLDGVAQNLAQQYAASGNAPQRRDTGVASVLTSAGYATFAETFSGWRGSPADADTMAGGTRRAGLGVAFSESSAYGVHWVLVLDE